MSSYNAIIRVSLILIVLLLGMPLLAQDDLSGLMEELRSAEPQYDVTESIVEFENKGQTIVGTLAMPDGAEGLLPIVLMFHGFTDSRDEMSVANAGEGMFSRAARIFAEQGYASLRIDFRGSGASEGAWEDTTFSGQISDAMAAIDYVSGLENIDANRIAVLGYSQGGLVAASTAGRDDRVKTAILWAAVAHPAHTYEIIMGSDDIQAGLRSGGGAVNVTLSWGAVTSLKTAFFEELFTVDPVAEITRFEGALMVVVGINDPDVTPQPQAGQVFLNYHLGADERLVVLEADHVLDIGAGPDDLDDAIAWSLAWLETTL